IIIKKQMINSVHEKGYRANPLTDEQKLNNTEKSRIRARVEHIFGFMEKNMNQMYLQCIGFKRINTSIGLMNLTYNMFIKIQLQTI
uniref:transposase n=1 Tax=Flavobacterium sp. TaxID=239 RepID=UPI00286C76C3